MCLIMILERQSNIVYNLLNIYIHKSCKDGGCTRTRNKLIWVEHGVIRLCSLPCKSVYRHIGFCSISKFRTAASSKNFPEKWGLVEEFRVHDGCTLSTMPRAARLFAPLYDQEAARKSRRCFARMAHSQSRRRLSAMMSRSTARIAACYILLVSNNKNRKLITYLTWDICDRAWRDFTHVNNLRNVCFDPLARMEILLSTSVVFDYISTFTFTYNILCGGGGRKNSFESLLKS